MIEKTHFPLFGIMLVLLSSACSQQDSDPASISRKALPAVIDYNFHIKPILSDRCYACHGPDENKREANLRLDTESGAKEILLDSEMYAVVQGEVEESALWHRIIHTDENEVMPPPASNLSLSKYEIALLERWIEQGADWQPHWSFIPPGKKELPEVRKKNWPLNPIDHFVLARMEQAGLKPSSEAQKEKLIRRLSFDLRGLPPSLEEIDAFLANESPNAYEEVVDTYLSSIAYGERMAMEWLDVARYADSHGYQDDLERSMWPWRDWVIRAFNENLPYDKFLTWQLAGDLLPDATYEQKLATAFNRNHKITQEVGVIDEEYRVEYVVDRTNTVSAALLGLTMDCARCHDHKYDPFTQKEYYQLYSFFNNVPEKGRVDYGVEVAEPLLELPQEQVDAQMNFIRELIEEQKQQVKDYQLALRQLTKDDEFRGKNQSNETVEMPAGLSRYFPLDNGADSLLIEALTGEVAGSKHAGPVSIAGKFSGALAFTGVNYADLGDWNGIQSRKPFSISMWVRSPDGGVRGTLLAKSADRSKSHQGFEWYITNSKRVGFRMTARSNGGMRMETLEPFPADSWTHLCVTFDGSGKADGAKMYRNGQLEKTIVRQDDLKGSINNGVPVTLGKRLDAKGLFGGQIDEVMFFSKKLDEQEVKKLYAFDPIELLLSKDVESFSEDDFNRLFFHHLHHKDEDYQELTERLREYRIREIRLKDVILKPTMVMADMADSVRPAFILARGQYNVPLERVYPGTPEQVLGFPEKFPPNRLGLAKWMLDPEHPLTARVAVNRYWQMIFGKGLVATPEDFGSQGALPSHPALLDWLAVEFQESEWDVKYMLKLMVMSATYRQSVTVSNELQRLDPGNEWLARGVQQRLPAEMVRDHALAISGLLTAKIGGPSVKPYQPADLWLATASGNQPLRKYIQDHGADLYRRSMYTFWKRTVPPPSMMTFDAATRNQCNLKRQSTSTPLQALVLLNDPQFLEASRVLAERMIKHGGTDPSGRITYAFRLATSRFPTNKELNLLNEMLQQEQADFEKDKERANQLLNIGEYPRDESLGLSEHAAYTVAANTILNLVESINK